MLRPLEQADAEKIIKGVETYLRMHGGTHRELAELAGIDAAAFTLFMQRKYPADWRSIAVITDTALARLYDQLEREAHMPVMTPVIINALGMARVLLEDGGIGLIQGDSGTSKTEAIRAVALRHERSIIVRASTARARVKPMLEDIGIRLGITYQARSKADAYLYVCQRMRSLNLLIIDEVHKYIGVPDCLNCLRDLYDETKVPQLWTATGDLLRYLDQRVGWRDPFAQIRSRVAHKLNLSDAGGAVIRPDDMRELAQRKFAIKLDAAAARELCGLAALDDDGSIRLAENTLKHAKRLALAGKLATIDVALLRKAMDKSLSKRTRERARQLAASEAAPAAAAQREPRETLRAAV